MPFSIKRFCKTAIFTGSFISITPMAPNTRTSCTSGKMRQEPVLPEAVTLWPSPFPPSAFQQERDRCRCDCTGQRVSHESGPVHETPCLTTANHIGYGCTGDGCRQCHVTSRQCLADAHDVRFHPAHSQAKSRPVRPNPVAISSKISNT